MFPAWMDTYTVTLKYCPRCRWYPFHGATERSLCCGLPFVTRTASIRWFIENRLAAAGNPSQFGGVYDRAMRFAAGWVKNPEHEWSTLYFPSQEALDRYNETAKIRQSFPYSKEWAIAQYTGG